ncbi:GTP 3',8-cyclase MoaA [Chloroflexota bacterium]
MAFDRFGRKIKYLRISLTDHCNFRCLYCMPGDMTFRPNKELMQDDEILYFADLFSSLGFNKIRLTGGEPTVRENIVEIVRGIVLTPGIDHVTMTTNGVMLPHLAKPLAEAGLKRVNISLDSLDPTQFKRLTRWGDMEDVWGGILAAEKAGLTPIKINVVVVAGYNENEVANLASLTMEHPWQVRFIEMMPFGGDTDFQLDKVITSNQIKELVESSIGKLIPGNGGNLDGEARIFHLPGAKGDIGFISSVTQPFCAGCTRARLTADGILRMCLLRELEVDLLTPLRKGAARLELEKLILDSVWQKPWGHGLAQGEIAKNRVMSEIGG